MARDEAYQEAVRRIEAAWQENAIELDLSRLGLTELPEAIAALTQLQTLDLSGNQLTEFPEGIAALTQLQTLDLTGNKLTELPEAIAALTQLQTLYLMGNKLTELPEAIAALTQLQSLHLSHNELTELPEVIAALTQLQSLHLFNNKLTELPEVIAALTQLQNLSLSENQLTELPEGIAALTQLQTLNLFNNKLTELPEGIAALTQLQTLNLIGNKLTELPEAIVALTQLQTLNLFNNPLTELPEGIAALTQLQSLDLSYNQLTELPEGIKKLKNLTKLSISGNKFAHFPIVVTHLLNLKEFYAIDNDIALIPDSIGNLKKLEKLHLGGTKLSWGYFTPKFHGNKLTSVPLSFTKFTQIIELSLGGNPLEPDLAAAHEQGVEAIMQYLRARLEGEVTLNEAKLILVGEGEVGKSCLLGALREDEWVESRPTTHGIEIKPVMIRTPDHETEITLNGWDFGGQRVYRPTHQLFFSSTAVYLVVWKPREGPQQGFVKEWITLIKHREPDAKVLVVATHGGPGQRQPDIDRQELIDLFGSDTILGFFHIDSKPNGETQCCSGIAELREAIANTAATLPGMGRKVPAKWQQIRQRLETSGQTHMTYRDVIALCEDHGLEGFAAELFVRVSHTLGYLIHYHYDPILRDIVILKPDWLAKAISFIFDDPEIRRRQGLVEFNDLSQLWSHPPFAGEAGYPKALHPIFLKLMERFDLSYKVVFDPASKEESTTSLIAQLVPDNRPEQLPDWGQQPEEGDRQQVQICRIVDDRGQSANAEGLFYQLIVRLHKYSLGRANYANSIHWQRGLMLDDNYNGRALLEHSGTEVRITVRAAYPEYFLYELTKEVKWLVEHFWEGLQCKVMVPCIDPCGINAPGSWLFETQNLIKSKQKNKDEYPCERCGEWQNIDELMKNAPPPRQTSMEGVVVKKLEDANAKLDALYRNIRALGIQQDRGFQKLDENDRRILSQADEKFAVLMQMLTDQAKEGPRLFSFKPVDPGFFDRPKLISEKFQLTLWCEHSRQPLPTLNPEGSKQGVYELELNREWFTKAVPYFRLLSLILPVVTSATQLMLDDATYKSFQAELDLGQKSLEFGINSSNIAMDWQTQRDSPEFEQGEAIRAQGSMLRELHAMLKKKDPGFGGLVQVQNKRREFLWVHPQFVDEY